MSRKRVVEHVWNISLPNGQGPAVFTIPDLRLPGDREELYLEVEGWISNFGGSNVHILEGLADLERAQSIFDNVQTDLVDMLLTVTGIGVSRRRLPDTVNELTVFFEAANASGQAQVVSIRVFGRE